MAGRQDRQAIERVGLEIGGIVQGVGFRPFVYREACSLGLTGFVRNSSAGVQVEIQGEPEQTARFEERLQSAAPPLSNITCIIRKSLPPAADETAFTILESSGGAPSVQVAPDSSICPDCLEEMLDPSNRRYRYPFINCTNCGPRYSIIASIPYDRRNTTMAAFPMCQDCLAEYHDPADRRFHAQPNACPVCGPQLSLLDGQGRVLAEREEALRQAVQLLHQGRILAVKGIGGYHLAVDACNHEAILRLRDRKKRDEKPFAVMTADLETARRLAVMDSTEESLLASTESPIVIVRKQSDCPVSEAVAPNNRWLGIMLPYAPLHHLLFRGGSRFDVQGSGLEPVTGNHEPRTDVLVMTSANISDEPIVYRDEDAVRQLAGIADYFLLHNRPIRTRCDDSVIRVFQGRPLFYRRSRGYAPRPVRLPFRSVPLAATGAELKGAVCLAREDQAFISQHLGDLQNSATNDSFRECIRHMSGLLQITPQLIACDLHPDYSSSVYATSSGLPVIQVQHHHAHLASCMAENGLDGEVIGIILDGTGYGSDGTIWGGEFLTGGYETFRRRGHFRPALLPGGDAAVKQPWRMALSYLWQLHGEQAFELDHPIIRNLSATEASLLKSMLQRGINSPLTSSCGRLFDAVAALLGVRHTISYDGQAAIELEALAELSGDKGVYATLPPGGGGSGWGGISHGVSQLQLHPPPTPLPSREGGIIIDFAPTIAAILEDISAGVNSADIARRFHNSVAAAAVRICVEIAADTGLDRVVLSGGVFQNRLLTELIYNGLVSERLQVFMHRLLPPNDGGIALGQAAVAGRRVS